MIQVLLALLVMLTGSAYLLIRLRMPSRGLFLPDAFILMLAAHLVGAAWLFVENEYYATAFVLEISIVGFLSACVVGSALLLVYRAPRGIEWVVDGRMKGIARFARYFPILLVGLGVGLVGALLVNEGVRGLLSGAFVYGDTSLLDARKAISSGSEGYVAPGVVKLLRDQFAPLLIAIYVLVTPAAFRRIGTWLSIVAILMAMIVGGQRYPIFLLLTLILIAAIAARRWQGKGGSARFSLTLISTYLVTVLFSFLVVSNFLGRALESDSLASGLVASFISLIERAVIVVPTEAVRTYEFWRGLGPTYGASWVADLEILIPGPNITTLASELHQVGGGSAQGNAPLFFSADAWLAFGMPGVVAASVLFFIAYLRLDHRLREAPTPFKDSARFLMFLSVPMIYSPYLFLLNGGITVLAMLVLERWRFKRDRLRAHG